MRDCLTAALFSFISDKEYSYESDSERVIALKDEMRHSRLFLSKHEFALFFELASNIEQIENDLHFLQIVVGGNENNLKENTQKWREKWLEKLNKNEEELEIFIDNLRGKYNRTSIINMKD